MWGGQFALYIISLWQFVANPQAAYKPAMCICDPKALPFAYDNTPTALPCAYDNTFTALCPRVPTYWADGKPLQCTEVPSCCSIMRSTPIGQAMRHVPLLPAPTCRRRSPLVSAGSTPRWRPAGVHRSSAAQSRKTFWCVGSGQQGVGPERVCNSSDGSLSAGLPGF